MSARPPARLTPKIRDLVATDRLGRRPVGGLTAAQAELLATVALGRQDFDEPVSAPRAIAALATGRPEAATPVVATVLADRDAPRQNRVAAATALGVIATPEAERLLLGAARDRDPRVQQAVFAALGWFGGPAVVRELGKIQPSDAHARRQMEFARALAVHRHGLDGPFLADAPAGRSRLTRRSATTTFALTAKTPTATANDMRKVQGPMFGVEPAAHGYALQCGRGEWTIFVHEALGRPGSAHKRLTARPWIAAVLCRWYSARLIGIAQYVLLTRPVEDAARIDVVRSDGTIMYTGTAEPLDAATAFSISDVERPGTAPVRLVGRLTAKAVVLELALAAPRHSRTLSTEPVAAG